MLPVGVSPNQKSFPTQSSRLKSPFGGDPTGGKAVPTVTSIIQPSTIGDEEPTKLFTCVLASIQSVKSEMDHGILSSYRVQPISLAVYNENQQYFGFSLWLIPMLKQIFEIHIDLKYCVLLLDDFMFVILLVK